MRHGFTLFFLAWGGVLILMALVKLVKGKALSAAAPVCCMGLIGIALAAGTWHFLGRQPQLAREPPPPTAMVEQPMLAGRPPASIELHKSGGSILGAVGCAVLFLLAAGWLVRYPDTLRTRWLSYPAAVVMVLLAVGAIFVAWGRRSVLYVADANGIEEVWEPATSTRVAWRDVAAVKEVERRTRQSRSALTHFVGRHLTFEDRQGNELLRLEDVAPADAYQRLLESIPAWTGLPVQRETVTY